MKLWFILNIITKLNLSKVIHNNKSINIQSQVSFQTTQTKIFWEGSGKASQEPSKPWTLISENGPWPLLSYLAPCILGPNSTNSHGHLNLKISHFSSIVYMLILNMSLCPLISFSFPLPSYNTIFLFLKNIIIKIKFKYYLNVKLQGGNQDQLPKPFHNTE